MWVNVQRIIQAPHCAHVVWPDLVVHVSAVAAVKADGFAVHADGERRTQHRYDIANVGRRDDMLEHGALVGSLQERLDSRVLALRLLSVAFQRGLSDRLPGIDRVDVDAVWPGGRWPWTWSG